MQTWGARLAALAVLASLGGCGDSGIDMDATLPAMEREIATEVQDQSGARDVEVECPDDVKWETGQDFRCVARDGRSSALVTVHMESDAGEYVWSVGR